MTKEYIEKYYIEIPVEKLGLKINNYNDLKTNFYEKMPYAISWVLDNEWMGLDYKYVYIDKFSFIKFLDINDIIEFLKIYLNGNFNEFSEYKIILSNKTKDKFDLHYIDDIFKILFYKCQILLTNMLYDCNVLKPEIQDKYDDNDDIYLFKKKYVPHIIHIKTLEKYDKDYIKDLLLKKMSIDEPIISFNFKDMEIMEVN